MLSIEHRRWNSGRDPCRKDASKGTSLRVCSRKRTFSGTRGGGRSVRRSARRPQAGIKFKKEQLKKTQCPIFARDCLLSGAIARGGYLQRNAHYCTVFRAPPNSVQCGGERKLAYTINAKPAACIRARSHEKKRTSPKAAACVVTFNPFLPRSFHSRTHRRRTMGG